LDEFIKKQKSIIMRLSTGGKDMQKSEKEKLYKMLKAYEAVVKKLQAEIKEETEAQIAQMEEARKAKELARKEAFSNSAEDYAPQRDIKKEILDAEMDIYHENLGEAELLLKKQKLVQLRKEESLQQQMGLLRGRGRGRGVRGRGTFRGRGRGGGGFNKYRVDNTAVDNRPKAIVVRNFDPAEKEELTKHFMEFGDIDRIEEKDSDKIIFTFKNRMQAEVASNKGTQYKDTTLMLAWYTGDLAASIPAKKMPSTPAEEAEEVQKGIVNAQSEEEAIAAVTGQNRQERYSLIETEDEDMINMDEEEMLLAGDGDDDEEDDRSWRR